MFVYVLGEHVESSMMMSSSSLVDGSNWKLWADTMSKVGLKICQNFKLEDMLTDVDIFSVKQMDW